ncbi:isochorismatase family protein [Actinomadura sp. LD22]|uniref:Isochorismatase family protein n=1 Tax=Actinomadura physcomitrii TaxID=2650748 RepID=A0A6I4MLB8_9ACTN|nr:isochorismatase family cysteine hydrolase [Actinomadura physcomitrii]MWA05730.1 isochorismatase family protein [Actinomadura physcomitrii]
MTNTALLVMDVQNMIVDRFQDDGYLPRLARAVDAARDAGIPVIYVVVGFRPGYPEVHPRNKVFGPMAERGFEPDEASTAVAAAVAPRPGEVVIAKKRISGFAGSDLDLVLRSGGIEHLVLTGIATSGVVLSTLTQAADLDFRLTVLADGCFDSDPEVHRVLTEKVFTRHADVVTVDAWTKTLTGA